MTLYQPSHDETDLFVKASDDDLKAIAAAAQIMAKAHDATEQEHARRLADLKQEVGHMVVETTAFSIAKASKTLFWTPRAIRRGTTAKVAWDT